MKVKDMKFVTDEDVLALRQKAIELEAENMNLKANQIPDSHFVIHRDDLYELYMFASEHGFEGFSFYGCMSIANQCCDAIRMNLDAVADRVGHPKFEDWKKVQALN